MSENKQADKSVRGEQSNEINTAEELVELMKDWIVPDVTMLIERCLTRPIQSCSKLFKFVQ